MGNKTMAERAKQTCEKELFKGTSIETISKYVNALYNNSDRLQKGYGENVLNTIIDNIEDIRFYINFQGYLKEEVKVENNDELNESISLSKIPLEKALEIRKRFFDARIKDETQKGDIEKVKELICKKYFGVTESDLPENIDILSEKAKKAVSCIKKIKECDTYTKLNEIMTALDTSEFKQFDNTVVNDVSKALKTEFMKRTIDLHDREPEYIEHDGKMIPIYVLRGEDFRGVIHATDRIRDIMTFEGSRGHICASEQSDRAFRFFRSGYKVGFSNLTSDDLIQNLGTDNMGTGSAGSSLGETKYYLENLSFNRDAVAETSKNGRINEIDIKPRKPDYILVIGDEKGIRKEELQIATELKIPIVIMDRESYFEKYDKLYKEKIEYIKKSAKDLTLKDFEELYEYDRQREAFERYECIDSTKDNETYKYRSFLKIFENIEIAKENPAFYNDVFNYITKNMPNNIEKLKEYISSKMGKDDNDNKETADSLFEKLETIHKKYLDGLEDKSQTL